jgi:hypothetical protein
MGSPKGSTGFGPCFPGPCYDYVACVTHQCGSDVACAVQTIFEFWARQYKAVSVHVDPFVAPLIAVAPLVARAALAALPAIQSITILKGLLDQPAYTAGCAPGEAWHWSLTGLRCMTTPNLARLATAEEVQAFIAATTGRSLD